MGLTIKTKVIDGVEMYQLRSTISDELYHTDEWVTIHDAKRALMESKIWRFIESLLEIDMQFPHQYHVNGRIHFDKSKPSFAQHALDNYYQAGGGKKLDEDFHKLLKEYSLEIQDPPVIQFGLYSMYVAGDEFGDRPTLVAISGSEDKLKVYCKETFNKEVGKSSDGTDYFIIKPYTVKIV